MHEVDIPDIFDVLVGGEDESAVKFLLGFSPEDDQLILDDLQDSDEKFQLEDNEEEDTVLPGKNKPCPWVTTGVNWTLSPSPPPTVG
jgi:hypothetical protein